MAAEVDLTFIQTSDYTFAVIYKTLTDGVSTPVDITGYTAYVEFASNRIGYATNDLVVPTITGPSGETSIRVPAAAVDALYALNTRRWRLRLYAPYVNLVIAYGGVDFV